MTQQVVLSFQGITYNVRKVTRKGLFRREYSTKTVLDDISGEVCPGDLVALMGASGAGKSTLLNVLSHRIRASSGTVLVNGEPASQSPYMRLAAYVQQEDMFYGFLTVKEHLTVQARLRVALGKAAVEERVQDILNRFSLNKSKNSRIGNVLTGAGRGISGGEKKRLSVATELLTNPALIFADEPTSGLDAAMAESVVEVLRSLASAGHTVITTIHQPSSDVFSMFNKVLLLAEGKVVYFGPREGVVPYFSRLECVCPPFTAPCEFVIELFAINWDAPESQLQRIERMAKEWRSNGQAFLTEWAEDLGERFGKEMEALTATAQKGRLKTSLSDQTSIADTVTKTGSYDQGESWGGVEQFQLPTDAKGNPHAVSRYLVIMLLLQRQIINTARDPRVSRTRLLQMMWTAFLGGMIFLRLDRSSWYSRAGACFFMTLNMGWFSMSLALGPFILDKPLILRERDSGLFSLPAIFTARVITDVLFTFYIPFLYTTICWWMMGLHDEVWRWLVGCIVLFCTSMTLMGLGYLLSAICPNMGAALALGPVLMLPLMMVSGFSINLKSLARFWTWLRYISPFTYAFSAAMRTIFVGWSFPAPDDASIMAYTTGEEVLESFDLSIKSSRWVVDFGALVAWIVLGRLIPMILFSVLNRRKY